MNCDFCRKRKSTKRITVQRTNDSVVVVSEYCDECTAKSEPGLMAHLALGNAVYRIETKEE